MTDKLETAMKYDGDKLRFDLVPPGVSVALAAVLGYGAVKYDDWNWNRGEGLDPERVYSALQRHLTAIRCGEKTDPETGFPHTWLALTNAAFLVALEDRARVIPDRGAGTGRPETAIAQDLMRAAIKHWQQGREA